MSNGLSGVGEGLELSLFQSGVANGLAPIASEQEGPMGVFKASGYLVSQLVDILDSQESAEIKRNKISVLCKGLSLQIASLPVREGVEKVIQFFDCFENNSNAAFFDKRLELSDFFDFKNPAIFIAFLIKDTKKSTISDRSRLDFYQSIFGTLEEGDLCVFESLTDFQEFFEEMDSLTESGNLGRLLAKDMLNYYITYVYELSSSSLYDEEIEILENEKSMTESIMEDFIDQDPRTESIMEWLVENVLDDLVEESELAENFIEAINTLYPKIIVQLKKAIKSTILNRNRIRENGKNKVVRIERLPSSTTKLEALITSAFRKPFDVRKELNAVLSKESAQRTVESRNALPVEVVEIDLEEGSIDDDDYDFDSAYDDDGEVAGL